MKKLAKSVIRQLPPWITDPFFSYRSRRFIARLQKKQGLPEIFEAYSKRYGLQVQDGPFKGMKYVSRAMGSTGTPKLIGSYECELHPWLTRLLQNRYPQVIDVGCAEGYYAVGVAMRLPGSRIVAYDIDSVSQRLCREMARLNHVGDRVEVFGRCTIDGVKAILKESSLFICDCEGFEQDLLDPAGIPALLTADIVVELHDFFRPGLTRVLEERLKPTHTVELVDSAPRDPAKYPSVAFLPPRQQALALSEGRNAPQKWALLTAKKRLL